MEEFKDYLFNQLQEYEKRKGKRTTINDFAEWLGVSRSLASLWLSGKIKPSFDNTILISEKLGNEVFTILGYSPPDPDLQYIERNWGKVPDDVQHTIIKLISETLQNHYKINDQKPPA